ncbi:sensor histidine kinase [Tamlana sp. 62-3]|uniref:histidine kinase n=1 Tax=Neotamlana sargassicola TaxID=2883125 RepID=A0A9X1L963_9FLAO|nr:sensor histidine kinase [Tamlana sargassicola]MCB4809598.1 sensor histidine kinase [Tamlana sargassicola]
MKYKLIFILFVLFYAMSFSQVTTRKLNDSAMIIYKESPNKAIELLEEALTILQTKNDIVETARTNNNLGIIYRDLGKFEEAKALSEQAIKVHDSIIQASAFNNIGACNRSLGMYEAALDNYLKALKIYEAKNYLEDQATVNNNIGMVYSYLGVNNKAVEFHTKAKNVFEKLNNKKGIANVYNNIAIIYANDGDLKKALSYFKYSLNIEEELKSKKGVAESLNNVGAVFYYMEEIDSALAYFRKSLKFEKLIGNESGLGASYNNIAQVLIENKKVASTKMYIDSAYYYATKSKTSVDIETALLNYSEFYEVKNDLGNSLKYFKEHSKFKDSILNVETTSKIAELEIEYETEKKEKEILAQRADLAEKELNINQKNTQIIGLVILALVLSALGYLLYNQQKLKNTQLKKEGELREALVKIETQNKLQDQRLRISRDLHDNIGAQLTFIISSIDNLQYGFNLKNEKLTNKLSSISGFTKETIYELRDTIWAMNKSEILWEDLQVRISNFIDKADSSAHAIKFKFVIEDTLEKELKFTSVKGMNIYRIIQEAINNAIKYAEASEVLVAINKENNLVNIKVEDNGKGFNISEVEQGNGLNNMKKRADEIKADFKIISEENKGTTIILNV